MPMVDSLSIAQPADAAVVAAGRVPPVERAERKAGGLELLDADHAVEFDDAAGERQHHGEHAFGAGDVGAAAQA